MFADDSDSGRDERWSEVVMPKRVHAVPLPSTPLRPPAGPHGAGRVILAVNCAGVIGACELRTDLLTFAYQVCVRTGAPVSVRVHVRCALRACVCV